MVLANMCSILPKPQLTSHPVDCRPRAEAAILSELVRRGYRVGEVDLFIVYCAENPRVYVIPADEVPNSQMHLRIDPPCNRQSKRVRWAKDYELPA
jgi:hypothetical protein